MLILRPSLMSCRMAGMPSLVAGTFTITLGRLILLKKRRASAMLPAVSWANLGDTSMLTKPSWPPVRS
jgi:hypothetical protein